MHSQNIRKKIPRSQWSAWGKSLHGTLNQEDEERSHKSDVREQGGRAFGQNCQEQTKSTTECTSRWRTAANTKKLSIRDFSLYSSWLPQHCMLNCSISKIPYNLSFALLNEPRTSSDRWGWRYHQSSLPYLLVNELGSLISPTGSMLPITKNNWLQALHYLAACQLAE